MHIAVTRKRKIAANCRKNAASNSVEPAPPNLPPRRSSRRKRKSRPNGAAKIDIDWLDDCFMRLQKGVTATDLGRPSFFPSDGGAMTRWFVPTAGMVLG